MNEPYLVQRSRFFIVRYISKYLLAIKQDMFYLRLCVRKKSMRGTVNYHLLLIRRKLVSIAQLPNRV